jgi:hypothetical protein
MRNLKILAVMIISVIIGACGNSSNNENKKDGGVSTTSKIQGQDSKVDLKTEEGLLKTLEKINIQIPDEFKFVEAKLEAPYFKSKFISDTLSEESIEKITEWFKNTIAKKENAGWKIMNVRDDEEIFGTIINEFILWAPDNVSVIDGMTTSIKNDQDEKIMTLSFSIDR